MGVSLRFTSYLRLELTIVTRVVPMISEIA